MGPSLVHLSVQTLVAVIWSASITTVFPIVKIVLERETAVTWVAHEIENGDRNVAAVTQEIEELEKSLAVDPENSDLISDLRLKSETSSMPRLNR